jgi:hypothetical protein
LRFRGAARGNDRAVAKYDPLFEHLCRADDGPLEMTFDEIDALVGGLPASASRQRPWWSNEVFGRNTHPSAWLNAGREVTAVDLNSRTVRFSAAQWRRGA